MTKLTPKMKALEDQHQKPIADLVMDSLNKIGFDPTAELLGVTRATLTGWGYRFKIKRIYVFEENIPDWAKPFMELERKVIEGEIL